MTNDVEATGFGVVVQFTRSSSKDGGEGFSIRAAEGVDEVEAARVMQVALGLRQMALGALQGKSLTEQLAESLERATVP